MGCPRIVLLHVYNCNVHRNLIMYSYLYTCTAPFGADGLINKINLFNSTGVTESYIANINIDIDKYQHVYKMIYSMSRNLERCSRTSPPPLLTHGRQCFQISFDI